MEPFSSLKTAHTSYKVLEGHRSISSTFQFQSPVQAHPKGLTGLQRWRTSLNSLKETNVRKILMTPKLIYVHQSEEYEDDDLQNIFLLLSVLKSSSVAGEHLLPGWTCCIFRDGLLPVSAGQTGSQSPCVLSVTENHLAVLLRDQHHWMFALSLEFCL